MKIKKYAEMLIDNWPAKVLSLAIAVFLFYFYKINSTEIRYISVPLEIQMDNNFIASEAYPAEVRLRLRGEPDTVSIVHENDFTAFADFNSIDSAGVYTEPVRVKKMGKALYAGSLEIRMEPPAIELKIEEKMVKTLEVNPVLSGYPEENHELIGYSIIPDKLTIEGPSSVIRNFSSLKTESINLAGRQDNFIISAMIDVNNPLIYFPDGKEIRFRGTIEKSRIVKNIAPLEIILINADDSLTYEIEVNSGSLRVEADRGLIDQAGRENSSLIVDLKDIIQPGVYNMPVTAQVEIDAEVISYSPETIRLYVSRKGRF